MKKTQKKSSTHGNNISDKQFLDAWQDKENVLSMKSAVKKYKKYLSKDEIKLCKLTALWRCINKHDETYGQKFTTSLYQFVIWQIQSMLSKKKKDKERIELLGDYDIIDTKSNHKNNSFWSGDNFKDNLEHVKIRMNSLKPKCAALLDKYYFLGYTQEQIGKLENPPVSGEAIRQRLSVALRELKELCLV